VNAQDLPEIVRALLRDHVESYEHLEVLLLLRREKRLTWTARDTAEKLHIGVVASAGALQHLVTHELIEREPESAGSDRFRYKPRSPTLEAAVAALAVAYDDRRVAVMALLSANAIERVRTSALNTFSEAVRLRRRKNDG